MAKSSIVKTYNRRITDGSTKKVRLTITEECATFLYDVVNECNEFPTMSDYVTAAVRYVVDVLGYEEYYSKTIDKVGYDPEFERGFEGGMLTQTVLFTEVYRGTASVIEGNRSCTIVGNIPLQVTISQGLLVSASKISLELSNKVCPLTHFVRAAVDVYTMVLVNRYLVVHDPNYKYGPIDKECIDGFDKELREQLKKTSESK